jgi:hypothetical protein
MGLFFFFFCQLMGEVAVYITALSRVPADANMATFIGDLAASEGLVSPCWKRGQGQLQEQHGPVMECRNCRGHAVSSCQLLQLSAFASCH